ncbi:WD40 repeat domain-containing protein [Nocardia sp. N2S4-5]|uniref:WD40 repeat domain-containing protein n=1 Tax=Nocardia sp. N2S4-5 TaxID=3351565 RepID=UPI0037D4721D
MTSDKPIEAATTTPSGLVIAASNGQLLLVDPALPGTTIARIRLANGSDAVTGVAVNADGRLLAAGTTSGAIHVWDIADPRRPREVATTGELGSKANVIAFSPDGRYLAASSNHGSLLLWNTNAFDPSQVFLMGIYPSKSITAFAFSPDSKSISYGVDDGYFYQINVIPGEPQPSVMPTSNELFPLIRGPVTSIAYSPDNHMIAVGGADGAIILIRGRSPEILKTGNVVSIVFSPSANGEFAVATDIGVVQRWASNI